MTQEEFIDIVKSTCTKAYKDITIQKAFTMPIQLYSGEAFENYHCDVKINDIKDFEFHIFWNTKGWSVSLMYMNDDDFYMSTDKDYDTLEKALASIKPEFFKQFYDIIQMYYKLSNEEAPL